MTLSGTVPNLWAKQEAIGRALQVEGVATVASELIITSAESDETLAQDVGRRSKTTCTIQCSIISMGASTTVS